MEKVKVGVIGCGAISKAYLTATQRFSSLEIAACADLDLERARARAEEYGIARACSVEELLSDESIEFVISLTIPQAHGEVMLQALNAGKHTYTEKPFCVTREDALQVLATAREKNLRVGSAPDTFLGGGIQTCRKLIDDGWIGEPVGATAFMTSHGPEDWHPNPIFYYQKGGGPMFDMGPYYLTAMVNLIGPVARVTGMTRAAFPTRTIGSEPFRGQVIPVETPTHVAGIMEFANGAIGTILTSFDVWGANLPRIEIYGTEGSLSVPDPNTFGGPVRVKRARQTEWQEVPLTHGNIDQNRGIGMADMASALQSGRAHRANGELAYHVLDLMHAFHDAANEGRHIEMKSTCTRPAPLPLGLREGELDS